MLQMRTARFAPILLLSAVGFAACAGDATGPERVATLRVAFLDQLLRLNTLGSDGERDVTPVAGAVPFAATRGAVIYLRQTPPSRDEPPTRTLFRYDLASRASTELPVALAADAAITPGAVSPDGARLAFASSRWNGVWLHVVDLATGRADSLRLSDREDAPSAPYAMGSTPVFSPSGDSVVFLLRNPIGMQILIYERPTQRLEVHSIPVPVTTLYLPLSGWPHWGEDATIRILAWLRPDPNAAGPVPDTVVVLRVFPRSVTTPAERVFAAEVPDSLVVDAAGAFSFGADGRAVAFAAQANRRLGIFMVRDGVGHVETLLHGDEQPSYPIVVP